MTSPAFTIGRLHERTGVNIETIRYYERIRLMAKPARSSGGRRLYDQEAVRRLCFIRHARELGFSIDEIRELLRVSDRSGHCADAHALTVRHLEMTRTKIADLKRLERTLATAAGHCARNASPDCPIIDAITAPRRV